MRSKRVAAFVLSASLCSLALSGAQAAVSVSFKDPDKFTDMAGREGGPADQRLLRELTAYFGKLGEKYLRPGQELSVEVSDIDRAGRVRPGGGINSPRILTDATWPKMTLRYELRDGGKLMASNAETLRDQSYLSHALPSGEGDDLRYEKRMLDDWFAVRFDPSAR
ncbi:MAG TPA: DUF3016 domain-containing protein [Alphaproteobacteria bacterium]|jgi:hypothetical protein